MYFWLFIVQSDRTSNYLAIKDTAYVTSHIDVDPVSFADSRTVNRL
jgi:hypothetical protein